MRQTDLAAALDIEGPSLVRLLDALERQGLVERCGEPDDRRVKTLRMTPAGHAMCTRFWPRPTSVSPITGCTMCPRPISQPATAPSAR